MKIDYAEADRIIELSFDKLNKPSARIDFPEPAALSNQLSKLILKPAPFPHQHVSMLATAGIEMWHRAIHSLLWSVVMTESSRIWASVSGYYSSHFVMRAFAHSMGLYKSFIQREAIQVVSHGGQFVHHTLSNKPREHQFYWAAVKGHPEFIANPLFRENNERETAKKDRSDAIHRNFANYADHLNSFSAIKLPSMNGVAERLTKIGRIRRYSVESPVPQRDEFPDIDTVQILAFQRIVAFHDFLENRVSKNRFWKAHRRPSWCRDLMAFQVIEQGIEEPSTSQL